MESKKDYQKPETAVTKVELESPICSGSVDFTAQSPTDVTTTVDQKVNNNFAQDNDFITNKGGWDQ